MYIYINLYTGGISELNATPHCFATADCFTTTLILFCCCLTTALLTYIQVEVLNSMQLLTAKQCVLLVNLSSGTHFTCFTSTKAQILTQKARLSCARVLLFSPQRTASAKKTNGSRKSRNGSTLTRRPTLSFP